MISSSDTLLGLRPQTHLAQLGMDLVRGHRACDNGVVQVADCCKPAR